jgi:predicted DNA-binding protein with PD1-like motif
MKSIILNDTYLVRCDIGDEIVSTLKRFALENKIFSGIVLGIGSIKDPELGYYDIHKKEYLHKQLKGDYELLGLTGNFARFGDEAALHCHVSLSDPQFNAIGGHLFRADVAVTTEFFIRPGGQELHRALDNATGLNLLNF